VRISDRELDVFDKDDFPAIAALMRYLLDAASCTKNRPDLINLNLVGLVEASIKKLDEALEGTHTFTLDLHHNIACMIDLLLNGNPDGTAIELIHTFFTSLRVVSTDSVEGIGLIPLMETESPVFVKVSKTKQRDNIIHEATEPVAPVAPVAPVYPVAPVAPDGHPDLHKLHAQARKLSTGNTSEAVTLSS
jgi:hypothetical protein